MTAGGNRPRYAPLSPEPRARAHLIVCDDDAVPTAALTPSVTPADFGEVWTVVGHNATLPEPLAESGEQHFRSPSQLLAMLRHRLARETMGLRLYAAGAETFVWDVARIATDAGMGREEFRLYAHGDPARRVSCVHCKTMHEGVATTLITCRGCGATLTVRDHFSRVHNAYMGVQADAEMPGELPAVEDLPS